MGERLRHVLIYGDVFTIEDITLRTGKIPGES